MQKDKKGIQPEHSRSPESTGETSAPVTGNGRNRKPNWEQLEKAVAAGRIPPCEHATGGDAIAAHVERDVSVGLMLLTRARLLSYFYTPGYGIIAARQSAWEESYANDLTDGDGAGPVAGGVGYRLATMGIDPDVLAAAANEWHAAAGALRTEFGDGQ